jgi:F-type H+-transporting ATPase subunit gamma
MAELARIESRLENLGQLGELFGALRSMAASRTREAQEALVGTQGYCETVDRAIASLRTEVASQTAPDNGAALLLVITSETGFVGGFNSRIMDRVQDLRAPGETLALVGRRGQILASERRQPVDLTFPMTSRVDGVTPLARRIAASLSHLSHARVVFSRRRKGAGFEVAARPILPLARPPGQDGKLDAPLHHLSTATLLDRLAQEYLFGEIAHALMQSLVSENSARLTTMDSASRTADEMIQKLEREQRAARQEQTTSDMLDMVVGTEAVTHDRATQPGSSCTPAP